MEPVERDGQLRVFRELLSDAAAGVALRRGDLVSARRLARAALDLMPVASWGVVVGSPLAHLLTALTRLGRFEEADEVVRSGLSPGSCGRRSACGSSKRAASCTW